MKKKVFMMLPCIAAVTIATFVGTKTFRSNANEYEDLLLQIVEALASGDFAVGNTLMKFPRWRDWGGEWNAVTFANCKGERLRKWNPEGNC